MKVVYNACFGGFRLSDKAIKEYKRRSKTSDVEIWRIARHDPILISIVEELGEEANGDYSDLKVKYIEGNKYRINEYDGNESVDTPESSEHEWTIV